MTRGFSSWLRRTFTSLASPRKRRLHRRHTPRRPWLEPLEDRTLLAVPTIQISDVTVTEGHSGTVNANFAVSLMNIGYIPWPYVRVNYTTANGSATVPSDYQPRSGTLTFLFGGSAAQVVSVPVIGDRLDEPNENFFVNLSGAVGGVIIDPQGVGTIIDDDAAPCLQVGNVAINERHSGTENFVPFVADLSNVSGQTVRVDYATADGTAVAPGDYLERRGTVVIPPGGTFQIIPVPIVGDRLEETDETLYLNLSNPVNATLCYGTRAVGTINDDDKSLTISDATVTEGHAGTVSVTFTAYLSSVSAIPVSASWATANGSATAPADYQPASGTLNIPPGARTAPITVQVVGDRLDEPNETFFVNLTNPSYNLILADNQAQGTIVDDDETPTLTINDVTVTEGNSGTVNATFTVSLSGPTYQAVTVQYATANGTAVTPDDYPIRNGTLTFLPETTTGQTVTVPVVGDVLDEDDETFTVNLSNALGAAIADGQGVGTIIDDDAMPSLAIRNEDGDEPDLGQVGLMNFTITLSAVSGRRVRVHWDTYNRTAVAPEDYLPVVGFVIEFPAGTTSRTVPVQIVGDIRPEPHEDFEVRLSSPTNATIQDPTGIGTIFDEDSHPAESREPIGSACYADPNDTGGGLVFLHNGASRYQALDLEIPGRGLNWKFERTYRGDGQAIGPLGHNWDFNDNRHLVEVTLDNLENFLIAFPNARVGDVVPQSGYNRTDLYRRNPDGSYTSPKGFFTRLVRNPDRTFVERDAGGGIITYSPADVRTQVARMTSRADRHGNTIRYFYTQNRLTRVVDTLGRPIDYVYNGRGLLTEVRDFFNRSLRFQYDPATDDLLAVTSPAVTGTPHGNDFAQGKTERYTYTTGYGNPKLAHNLLTVTAPNEVAVNGPPRVVFTYDTNTGSPNLDRVLSLTLGGTNGNSVPSGGTLTYAYRRLATPPPGDLVTPAFETLVTDANGNQTEYLFDQLNNTIHVREFTNRDIRRIEPEFYWTRCRYNQDYRLVERIFPEGNQTAYAYDTANQDRLQQGNLLSSTRSPDAARGGDQASLRSATTYEPLFNQVRTSTDPRGTDPTYIPPINPPASAGRYTTVSTFDYQEGTNYAGLAQRLGVSVAEVQLLLQNAGIPMGLGDVNGDGRTDQIVGNVIRVESPRVHLLPRSNQAAIAGAAFQSVTVLSTYNQFGQLVRSTDPEGNVSLSQYYPERDPNGDGVIDNPSGDSSTGGYLMQRFRDTVSAAGRNSGTNPAPTQIRIVYSYDPVGNLTRLADGRGVVTDYLVNQLNQVVQVVYAATHSLYVSDPAEPLPLMAFQFRERSFYDHNGNLVLRQVEDRNNTVNVDGSGLGPLPAQAVNTTPGLAAADPTGGTAYVDTLHLYDILDNPVETRAEVDNARAVATRLRYDVQGNLVLTIHPDGNADGIAYDERDLVFQSIRGAAARPVGLYAPTDPTTFNRPGSAGTPPSVRTHNYDRNRNLVEVVDAFHHGGARSVIAGVGDVTRTDYDGFDRRRSVTDPLGNQTLYTYDPASNVVRVVALGAPVDDVFGGQENRTLAVTEYVHDELSRLIVTHQVLFRTPGTRTLRTSLLTDNPAMDVLAAYLADAPGDTAAVPGRTDLVVLGRVTTLHEYDRNSRPTFTIRDDLDVVRAFYDGAGRVIKTTDSVRSNGFSGGAFNPANLAGNTVESAYDDNGNLIERKETDVALVPGVIDEVFRTTFFHDALNRLQTQVDNRGHAVDYRYDSRNNLVAKADAVGPVTARTLPRRGLGASNAVLVNDFGNVTRIWYDGLGRKLQTEVMLTPSRRGDGNYIGADPDGRKLPPPTGYLDLNQAEDGLLTVYYAWTGNGDLLAQRDDDGNTTGYIHDNQGRVVKQRKGMNAGFQGTSFCITGGACGLFRGPRTPADPLRDPAVETESAGADNGTTINFSYDPDANLAVVINEGDVNGTRSTFSHTYDALNRRKVLRITNPPGSAFVGTTLQTWSYDGLSRLTVSRDDNGFGAISYHAIVTGYIYDSLSRQLEERQVLGKSRPKIVAYHYDIAAGGAVALPSSLTYPDGRRVDSTYDRLDRLVSRRDQGAATDIGRYEYLGTSRVATLTFQNGTRLSYLNGVVDAGYDTLRRIMSHRWERFAPGTPLGAGTLLVGYGYRDGSGNPAYDRAHNKLIEEKLHDLDNSEVYAYDGAYRLTRFARGLLNAARTDVATPTTLPNALQGQTWNLDGQGNWTANTHTLVGLGQRTESRTHSDFNEIVAVGGTPYGGGAAGTHALDKSGNLLDDGVRTYQWDALNRLRKVFRKSDGLLVAEYTYDAGNRRVRKVVSNGGVAGDPGLNGTTEFSYDGWRVVEERDPAKGNHVQRQYVYGNYLDEVWTVDDRFDDGSCLVMPVSALNDGVGDQRLFAHANPLFHVSALTDETGALREGYQYDPYGKAVVFTGPGADSLWFTNDDAQSASGVRGNPYTFTGQRFDPETGQMYYKNRYYSPTLGRFLSRDPSGYVDGMNLYGYASNVPVSHVDSHGLDDQDLGALERIGGKLTSYISQPGAAIHDVVMTMEILLTNAVGLTDIRLEDAAYESAASRGTQAEILGTGTSADVVISGRIEDFGWNLATAGGKDVWDRGKSAYQALKRGEITEEAFQREMFDAAEDQFLAAAFGKATQSRYRTKIVVDGEFAEMFAQGSDSVKLTDGGRKPYTSPRIVKSGPDPAHRRPGHRKSTVEQVKKNQEKTPEGDYIEPNTREVLPENGPIDMGHKPGHEWWRNKWTYRSKWMSRQDVIEAENDPNILQIESQSSNRGHKHEQK